jgi:signal transduction histidine kinase
MFFARVRHLSQRLGIRLAFFFTLICLLSALLSFGAIYLLLSRQLKKYDQNIIEAKWREYSEVYRRGGVDGLKSELVTEKMKEGDVPLLVQIVDANGNSLFLKVPEDSNGYRKEIDSLLRRKNSTRGWSEIRSPHEDDRIDFLTAPLENQAFLLRVGKSSDPRDDLMEQLSQVFVLVCVGFTIIGAAIGMLLSHRALAPLRSLVQTMKAVSRGSLSSRVPSPTTGDEMGELTSMFNQMLDRVERLVNGMKETLDNVAHDLRTPVARMRAASELRLREAPGPEDRSALEDCAEFAEVVSETLNSILDLAEAESGTMKLKLQKVSISNLVKPVIELYEMVAEDKAILISFEARIDPEVTVDAARIKQALGNLCDNAIKYSKPGSEVAFSATESQDAVTITVRDRGEGIHPDDIPRIWDRLFRADRSRSQPGQGIGLSIVRAIVKAHGGTVDVTSEVGVGSTFFVRLPKPLGKFWE